MNPSWIAELVDVEGAFLQVKFVDNEQMYIEIPDGFEKFYRKNEVRKLNVPIYGTKQAASCFYKTLVDKVQEHKYERLKAHPCLYFCWRSGQLSLMILWVDDLILFGIPNNIKKMKSNLMSAFKCKLEGC